jgi:colanic acid/amylovoran biosynthesis glycosyltransferase
VLRGDRGASHPVVVHSSPIWLPQTQTWMYNQVRYLPAEVESHVVCEQVENLDQFGLPHIHTPEELPRLVRLVDRFAYALRLRRHRALLPRVAARIGARVVHSHFGNIGWMDRGGVRQAGARHVVTFYGQDVTLLPQIYPRWRKRYRQLFASVDRVLCEGPHMGERIVELGCPRAKVCVHHLGVEVEAIPFEPRMWNGSGQLRVLIAATFREKKGVPYALEALARLRRDVPLQISIVGDASSEERSQREKARILGIIRDRQLEGDVRLLGFRSQAELMRLAYEHHLFLSPSVVAADGDTEGGAPVSLIEMAASGMPVVSTTHCDIPNVFPPEYARWLAAERDVDGLVGILRALVGDPSAWRPLLEQARARVENEFSASEQGVRLGAIYRELAGE